ncbi:hypothetical protein [uncultured Paludibaculum sp.]|uniref:hypothetical protein n=1 Tax=uncultured Paludibaculum sp. TaxID=1765020 RepID=UPI002AAB126B|nr:hypothetical protein [uncultured Paludibaculum sp.]
MRTTADQEQFIGCLLGPADRCTATSERVRRALGECHNDLWGAALCDLITILGDDDDSFQGISVVSTRQLHAMRRNWAAGASEEELRRRIFELRLIYDWPALKSAVRLCPGSTTGNFRLNDLFNLLDMHIAPGAGFRAPAAGVPGHIGAQRQFFDTRRLIGAKNALVMTLVAMFYIDYQVCIESKREVVEQYHKFALLLGQRMQRQGLDLAHLGQFDQSSFYEGDVGFVSLNYDPIALWIGFLANRTLNTSPAVPHIGSPPVPLYLFHDMGHLIPSRGIGRPVQGPWYPMNEAVAQRLNEVKAGGDHKVRLSKFLFPHGSLCWRECPDCGKLSAFHGDEWTLFSRGLIPPPPLLAFDPIRCADSIPQQEQDERHRGRVDARECLHCGTLTFAQHTQVVMQSSLKPRAPSSIEEIERELRATTMLARHIIFMGYSLPPDDVTLRAFFSARRQSGEVLCTVVDKGDRNPGWYGPADIDLRLAELPALSPVRAARDIFGPENVRFFGGGIPDVFLDGAAPTNERVNKLLNWAA